MTQAKDGTRDLFKIIITALLTLIIGGLLAGYTTVTNALERLDNVKADKTEIKYITNSIDDIRRKQEEHTRLLIDHMRYTGQPVERKNGG